MYFTPRLRRTSGRIMHGEVLNGGLKEWNALHKPTFFPLVSQFPHNIHLLSLKSRDSITDDVIVRLGRIQRCCYCCSVVMERVDFT